MLNIILWFLFAAALGWFCGQGDDSPGWPYVLMLGAVGFFVILALYTREDLSYSRLLVPENMRAIISGAYISGLSLGFGVARSN